ncbi:MAG: hypoxanthine phosphoribosyltransferase [Lentisphaeria bacterium]|nr:hypoxanthine phosphoribosyltransferase [Lentisphaeria bacterium]
MTDHLPANDPRFESILLSAEQIAARIREIAATIAADYADTRSLHLLGVLKGACIFLADLGREIRRADGPSIQYEFIRASTYAGGIKEKHETSRPVAIASMPESLRGQDVLIVEDILDQGFTLHEIRRTLLDEMGARSVRICVLLNKQLDTPTPEVADLRERLVPDYVGFDVPDRWVAGYGLDIEEEFRDLPYVAIVREEQFQHVSV